MLRQNSSDIPIIHQGKPWMMLHLLIWIIYLCIVIRRRNKSNMLSRFCSTYWKLDCIGRLRKANFLRKPWDIWALLYPQWGYQCMKIRWDSEELELGKTMNKVRLDKLFEIQQFHGLSNDYLRYIPTYSEKVELLTRSAMMDETFMWQL